MKKSRKSDVPEWFSIWSASKKEILFFSLIPLLLCTSFDYTYYIEVIIIMPLFNLVITLACIYLNIINMTHKQIIYRHIHDKLEYNKIFIIIDHSHNIVFYSYSQLNNRSFLSIYVPSFDDSFLTFFIYFYYYWLYPYPFYDVSADTCFALHPSLLFILFSLVTINQQIYCMQFILLT